MKKKKTPYLDFYNEALKSDLPRCGLCSCFPDGEIQEWFDPTEEEMYVHAKEGYGTLFWAAGLRVDDVIFEDRRILFTPLRQNIVLLLAAMNNEL